MAATLPYMNQLPRDFFLYNYPAPAPTPTPVVPDVIPPVVEAVPPTSPSEGGTYFGDTPPVNPGTGWMWLNSANNGLYVFTIDGIWEQIGTNW